MRPLLFPFLALGLAAPCAPAAAATYTVTKGSDTFDGACDADCSLREAVSAANASPGSDTIRLRQSAYLLTLEAPGDEDGNMTGDLDIADAVTIRGIAGGSAIDAGRLSRVLEVLPGASVVLEDLAIRNGFEAGRGGGIYSGGELTLRRVKLKDNRVVGDGGIVDGGGLYNAAGAVLRVIESRISNNVARDDATLTGGRGAGLFNEYGAQVYMYDSDVRTNIAGEDDSSGYGGGLYNEGQARIERCFFGWNSPGDGEGSAIANRNLASLTLISSTLSANGHDGADGALANGTLSRPNELPKAYLLNVTIADNNGGGVMNAGRLAYRNTLIGGNYTQDGNDRYYHAGYNCRIVNRGSWQQWNSIVAPDGNCPTSDYPDNERILLDRIERLAYRGGPTPVHFPRDTSGMIDYGDWYVCPPTDQRNLPRPVDREGYGYGGSGCDIGAVEWQPGE